jgi:hypothetical protein
MNEAPWDARSIPKRYMIGPNKPRYPEYAPFVYNRFEKGQNRYKKELETGFFSGTGGSDVSTVGHPMYSPFPGKKISYDSHNLPNKKMYNNSTRERLARQVERDNDERYRVSRMEGTALRKPFRDC